MEDDIPYPTDFDISGTDIWADSKVEVGDIEIHPQTPASGGRVGQDLLDKGADANAPSVPSSRDTALVFPTATDNGDYRVDVKNKKGNSLLACNGGPLDIAHADIDSQDNRKVSCLMAAFKKGHVENVERMVKHVNQFPSNQELSRYISTVQDKELAKKCRQSMEIIVSAKDRQTAEANKIASILLEELDKERETQEKKKAVAAKRREKKKKKKEKQEKEKETTTSTTKSSTPEPETDWKDEDDEVIEDQIPVEPPSATVTSLIGFRLKLILVFLGFLFSCVNGNPVEIKVGLYYNHIGKDVHMTCKTNDSDPSFEIEKWRVSKVFGGNNDVIYYGNWTANDTKYEFKDIDGVRYFIIRNFSKEDGKYCYYCTIGFVAYECNYITDPEINVDESCNKTGPPDQCKDPMSTTCSDVSGDYKCSCKPGCYNNGGTCTFQINVDESCNKTGPPDQCKDPMSTTCSDVSGDYKCSCKPGCYNNGGTCTFQINVDESCNKTGPPDQCKDPMSTTCSDVSGDYKCSCKPGCYNNGGTCTFHKEETGLSFVEILLIVGGFGLIAGGIVLVCYCICKKR